MPLPGAGYGTPVIWGDRVFLTAAVPIGPILDPVPDDAPGAHDNAPVRQRHRFIALAIDRTSGEIVWETVLHEQLPHAGFHVSGALAAASAVTDGEHLIAFFGSYGIYGLDLDGEVSRTTTWATCRSSTATATARARPPPSSGMSCTCAVRDTCTASGGP